MIRLLRKLDWRQTARNLIVFFYLLLGASCEKGEDMIDIDDLRINEIQVIGSHNSYRIKTYQKIMNTLSILVPELARSFDYEHQPLEIQFNDYGMRQIELDIYYDPEGGHFANRLDNQFISEPVESGELELDEPGFKVLHFPDIDYMTHYITFKDALATVKAWSEAHPNHVPIFILVEAKEEGAMNINPNLSGFTEPLPFDSDALDSIDEEIRDVFEQELNGVITPDDVRRNHATLEEAILSDGWPTLGEARGKVMFGLDNGGGIRDLYVEGHEALKSRILFTNSDPGTPEAAFIKINNPTEEIEQLVLKGYLIRTRADSDTEEARSGDTARRNLALASGAHYISSDYYRPDPRHTESDDWTDYSVQLPGGEIVRLNPVNGPEEFAGLTIEE